MATKATHDGTCQVCGSTQRLPGGVLAKHGYTTRWGFFTGTCHGAGSLPFEQSIDLIEAAISTATSQKEVHERDAAALRDPKANINAGSTAWVHEYVPATWQVRHSSYRWIRVEVLNDGKDYPTFSYLQEGGKSKRLDLYSYPKSTEAAVLVLNADRAKWHDRQAEGLATYIGWQQERIANWTPKPLTPRAK